MKLRNTFLLVLVTVALLVGVAVFEKHHPSTRHKQEMMLQLLLYYKSTM